MIGSPYEFSRGHKTKDFPLLSAYSTFTDDTVMTIAVAEALLDARNKNEEETLPQEQTAETETTETTETTTENNQ